MLYIIILSLCMVGGVAILFAAGKSIIDFEEE
ncbi:hypothetical protein COHCIP112018_00961 [Cohnella sp. JJ-181]|nr:hypothetical protein COHCIP112018_00961 [Cohnella sp. JJ-181]